MRTRGTLAVGGLGVLLLALAPAAAQTPVFIASGVGQPKSFGTDADAVGDWDGDGIGDVVVGIPEPVAGSGLPGLVRIFSGHDGSQLAQFSGTLEKQRFGALVAGAGDVDADGAVDLLVGAVPQFGSAPASVQVFSGASGALLLGQDMPATFALSDLDGAGDVDADGHADVVKGGFDCAGFGGTFNPGDARVFSGATGELLHTWCGDGPGDHFGEHVTAAGDVNLDGYADILVGVREADDYSPEGTGYVRVLSGFDYETLYTFEGPPTDNNGFGETVDTAGDVNGDGRPDILVGARQEKVDGIFHGSASVYSGFDGALLHHVLGPFVYKQFGMEVAGPGDVDGDGLADFAVATQQLEEPAGPAAGYTIYSGADATKLHDVPLNTASGVLGFGLRAAGDLNGDGLPDLLMITDQPGAPGYALITVRSGAPVLFADLGFALPGSQGTPHLEIEGILHHGVPLTLSVTTAPPLAPLFLVLGNAAAPVPFHGGTLVPVPQIIVTLATDAAGALTVGTTGPTLPAGMQLVVQGWLPDAPAPTHFAATNAVLGVAP